MLPPTTSLDFSQRDEGAGQGISVGGEEHVMGRKGRRKETGGTAAGGGHCVVVMVLPGVVVIASESGACVVMHVNRDRMDQTIKEIFCVPGLDVTKRVQIKASMLFIGS
jgi:hypothetical protein